MTHCSDEITRRILNFPAILPCESISFPTLLSSLIELCRSICEYSEKTILVNRKNTRSCIRLVKNLLVFLEEIPDGVSVIRSSITLSLSEVHFILQKVRFLVEDCTREDARMWMLMNSGAVADEMRVLIRAVAAALDVLDLEGLGVGDDVKELAEFVKNQGLRLKFEAEVFDEMTLREVFVILGRFEGGVDPGLSELKTVVEYLGIRSWGECNREIKFLEEEIRLEWGTEKRRNLGVLSSLLGLMIYSRSVLFPVAERMMSWSGAGNVGSGSGSGSGNSEFVRKVNADDFRCPISLELMSDPVVIATGQTYERSSILKWFRAGNPTCPKTGEKVMTTDLVPNSALQKLVRQFCSEKNIPFALPDSAGKTRDPIKMVAPGSLAAEKAAKLLSRFLVGKLRSSISHEQSKAAYEIRLLTKTSVFNRSCLVESGAIAPLLNLLFSNDPLMQENAVASLLNLSKFHGSRRVIVESGGLMLILDVLKEGLKIDARNHAAGALFYLASDEEYRLLIGEIPEAISALVDLLRNGSERGKKNALVAIFGLLSSHENHHRVLAAGLVPLLIHLLRSLENEDLRTDSLAVLATVAEKPDGANAILSSGSLPLIVEILSSATSIAARECCVSILLALSVLRKDDVVPVLVKNPSLMGALYSQITQGSSRSSKKASSLIKILQNYGEKSLFGGFSNSAHSHERFIHVW